MSNNIKLEEVQKAVNENNLLFETLSVCSDDYVFITDFAKNTTQIPPQMAEDFDFPGETIRNFDTYFLECIHPDDQRTFIQSHAEIAEGRVTNVDEVCRIKNKKGDWIWMKCRAAVIDSNAENIVMAGTFINLSNKNKVDGVTGLLNKFEFESAVNRLIERERDFYVMVLNVDNFSQINELYDRNFGDDVLRINAQYIQNVFSNAKGVYRLDSDDFGVIFIDTNREEVTASYNRLQTHYSVQQTHKERRYFFTLSAGCVKFDNDSDTFKLLLKNAHVALDFAKYNGKNNLVFYATQTINRKLRELEISNALKESVDNGFKNFELFVQPQVDALTGKLKGGEALLRWSCEKYGAVSPVEFIPLLEENNYILPVGRWVFEHAVEQLANWIVALPNFQISINVSYLQLLDATFLEFLKKTVEKNKVPYENIIIELTESRFINDKDTLRGIFVQLRTLGIEIAMDDFGTGYSSLEVLKDIPADIVKIDRTFVRNIINSNFDMTFIRFIVELCHSVGMKVCLEGIEELEEMNAVSDINLDFIQGYLFGRPSAHSDFTKENFG